MGLDNYLKASPQSPTPICFPADLHLCGGMFSGHGSDGSFRGKVYDAFFSQEVGVNLYDNANCQEVHAIAKKLEKILVVHPAEAWDGGWREDAPSASLGYNGVTNRELRDLVALFQAATEQKMELVAWY